MRFVKYHGLGNDFIFVNADAEPGIAFQGIARAACDRHFGIGADGLVTLRHLDGNRFEMRIYNSDGTETEMCGNATRCAAAFIVAERLAPGPAFELSTRAGLIRPVMLSDGRIRVDMGEPRPGDVEITLNRFTGTDVSMGNPHFVVFVPDVAAIRLETDGPELEHHPHFPNKSNIEFVQVLNRNLVRMRVWERGCGVTLACGTGSSATCVAGVLTGRTDRNITVRLDGGELDIEWNENDNHVYMTGPATRVFTGSYPA